MSEQPNGPSIRFDVMPPDVSAIWLPILSPGPGQAIRGTILSEHMLGVWTHYVQGRTEPHLEGPAGCPGCCVKRAKRWKGYYAIHWTAKDRMGLAELTPWAVANCPLLRAQPYRTVRGWLIEVSRANGMPQGRVACEIQPPPYRRDPPALAEPPDVAAALLRIWSGRRDGPTGRLTCGEPLEEPPF